MKYFNYQESNSSLTRLMIGPANYDTFPFNAKYGGSFHLAPCRVLGLSYADYLRFLRAAFPEDVEIEGKGTMYPVAYWRKGEALFAFIDLLNNKLTLAMKQKGKENVR